MPGRKPSAPGAGCGPAVHHLPAAGLQRQAERHQGAEHVGVGVDVAQHQRPAGRPPQGGQHVRRGRTHRPAHRSPWTCLRSDWILAACSIERSARKSTSGVTRRSRCWRSQLRTNPRALVSAASEAAHCALVAEHRDEDLGHPQILGGLDLGDRDEAQARDPSAPAAGASRSPP